MLEEMDDNEYLLEMLTAVLDEVPKDIKIMQQALEVGNFDVVCKTAHKLKSSTGVIQAEKLTALLADIERHGKKTVMSVELINLVENAAQQYNQIGKSLQQYVTGLK